MGVSQDFFNIFMQVSLEVFYVATGLIYAYWIKPFVKAKHAAITAAVIYYLIAFIGQHVDLGDALSKALAVCSILFPVLTLYLMDGKRNLKQKIFICVVFPIIWWIILECLSEIGFYERDLVMSIPVFQTDVTAIIIEYVVWNLLYFVGTIILLFLSFRLLIRKYRHKNEELTGQEFVMMTVPAISVFVVKHIVRSYYELWIDGIRNGSITENIPGDIFRIIFCILAYISVIVLIIFYQKIKESQDEIYAGHMLEKQMEDTRLHMEEMGEMYEKMRSMRHEMGNHIAVLGALIENGDKEEALNYVGKWKESFEETGIPVKTGNAVTDIVLSQFRLRFDKAGIPFESGFVYPTDLKIDPFDLSIVLSDALQNAYEASENLENPKVSIKTVIRSNTYLINIRNRTASGFLTEPENGIPISTKKEDGHGYGLKNIRSIAQKYNGDIEIRQDKEDGVTIFILNIMMLG